MPAGIEFQCPNCGRTSKVALELAGKQGRCPGCRKILEVPRLGDAPGAARPGPARPEAESEREVTRTERAAARPAKPPAEKAEPEARPAPAPRPRPEPPPAPEPEPGPPSPDPDEPPAPPTTPAASEESREESTKALPASRSGAPEGAPAGASPSVPLLIFVGMGVNFVLPPLGLALGVVGLVQAQLRRHGVLFGWLGIAHHFLVNLLTMLIYFPDEERGWWTLGMFLSVIAGGVHHLVLRRRARTAKSVQA